MNNFDRNKMVFLLRESGKTFSYISKELGISQGRAKSIYDQQKRIRINGLPHELFKDLNTRVRNVLIHDLRISSKEECISVFGNYSVNNGHVVVSLPSGENATITLYVFNEVRSWLGMEKAVKPKRKTLNAPYKSIEKAIKLLEKHGYKVVSPSEDRE